MQLPSNSIAESMIIGCAMLERGLVPQLITDLTGSDFSRPSLGAAFNAIKALYLENKDINGVTVVSEVNRQEAATGITSGLNYAVIAETLDGCPRFSSFSSVQSYVAEVKTHSLRRKLVHYAERLRVESAALDVEPEGLLLSMAETSRELGQGTSLVTDLVDTSTAMERTLRRLEENWAREGELLGLSTGFVDLDRHLLGLLPGVYVLAAGTSVGKTTFALNIVNNILLEAERKQEPRVGLIVSMEMGVESLSVKLLATRARLDTKAVKRGTLNRHQQSDLLTASTAFKSHSLHFVEGFSAITPMAIAAKLDHLRTVHGRVDFLVIDYLQLLSPTSKASTEYAAVTEIAREVKRLSHQYQIPIILISQLSRQPTANGGNRDYRLSDLRGSGAIEQDADVVLLLMPRYWDNPQNPERRLVIAKDREGERDVTIPLIFFGEQSRFESAAFAV
jgi:replicative DNA helicase